MAKTVSDIVVAGNGDVWVAPSSTSEPTFSIADTNPSSPWVNLGYVSENGVTFGFDQTTVDIKAWQAFGPLRTIATDEPASIAFELIQFDPAAVRLALRGGSFTATGTGDSASSEYLPHTPGQVDERALYITAEDGTNQFSYYFPRVQVNGNISIQLQKGAEQMLAITFSVLYGTPRYVIRSNHAAWVAAEGT